jgi:hypothetical protein
MRLYMRDFAFALVGLTRLLCVAMRGLYLARAVRGDSPRTDA